MSINRRALIKMGAAAGGGLVLSEAALGALPLKKAAMDGKGSLLAAGSSMADKAVLSRGDIIPMNAANLTPMLSPLAEKIKGYTLALNADVSFVNRQSIVKDTISQAREKAANMLGIKNSSDLAFVRNTSEANSIINNGIDLGVDDEVLLWNQNHPTNLRSWYYRQQRRPFRIKQLTLSERIDTEQDIISQFMSQLTPNTRVVSFTELSNISGMRLPAKSLCSAIHSYNKDIFVHVDGAQSWGCLDVNLDDMGCDSFSSSGHKWLMGPRGTGILYMKEQWASKIWPSALGYDFLMEYPEDHLPTHAGRFECFGQRDVAPYAAIGDCVDFYQSLGGSKKIEQKIQELTQYALTQLDNVGIKTLTPRNKIAGRAFGHGVVIADLGGAISTYGAFLALHNAGIATAFVSGASNRAGGAGVKVCCEQMAQPPKDDGSTYLRLSPHIYNSRDDIDKAVAVIKRINESKFEIVKEVVRFL